MTTLILNVDAQPFAQILSSLRQQVMSDILSGQPIVFGDIFDTPALSVTNSSGREQVQSRSPISQEAPGLWKSEGSFIPMRLRYQLYQDNRPLRIDVSVLGDLILKLSVMNNASDLQVALESTVSASILDEITVSGVNMRIPDVLNLTGVYLEEGVVTYAFRRRGDMSDYIRLKAAWSPSTVASFDEKAAIIEFSRPTFATRLLSSAVGRAIPVMKCGGGGSGNGPAPSEEPLNFIKLDLREKKGFCEWKWFGKMYYLRNLHPDKEIEVTWAVNTSYLGTTYPTDYKSCVIKPDRVPVEIGCDIPGPTNQKFVRSLHSAKFV